MSEVSLITSFRIILTNREFHIILDALRGELKESDKAEADALLESLSRQKTSHVKHWLKAIEEK